MTTLTGLGAHTPLTCTFRQLARTFLPLHQMERRYLDTLHDVWKRGAPTPNSRITQPKGYDERLRQRGNYEARIVPAPWLAAWVYDVATARGIPMDTALALKLIEGDDLELPKPIQQRVGSE